MAKRNSVRVANLPQNNTPINRAMNPIKNVGLAPFSVQTYPHRRYIDYTESDWRRASDRLINNGLGQDWDALTTWMVSSSTFIQTLIDRRINPILGKKYAIFDPDGNIAEDLSVQLDKAWFLGCVRTYLMSIFQGYSAASFSVEENKCESYPIAVIDPFNNSLKRSPYAPAGEFKFSDYDNLIFARKPAQQQTMLGLFQPMAREFIGIATQQRNWLVAGTRFAYPMTIVGYNGLSVQSVQQPDGSFAEVNVNKDTADYIAQNYDPSSALSVPFHEAADGKNVYDIEVKQSDNNSKEGAYKTYSDYIDKAEIKLINLVLGATLTMTEGNSRSLGEVHERVTSEYQQKDLAFVIEMLNEDLFHKLNLPDGYLFGVDETSQLTIDEAEKISKILGDNGKKMTKDFFTAMGIPDIYYQDNEIQMPEVKVNPKEEKDIEENKDKNKEDNSFFGKFLEVLSNAVGIEKKEETKTVEPVTSQSIYVLSMPNVSDDERKKEKPFPIIVPLFLADNVLRALYETGQPMPVQIQRDIYSKYAKNFTSVIRKDVVPDADIPKMVTNAFQFSAAKNSTEQAAINQQLTDALMRNGKKVTYAEFKESVAKVTKQFREDWLRTEYNSALRMAEAGKEWKEIVEQKATSPYWIYKTREDSSVRPLHEMLNNKVFRIDDPAGMRVFPPIDWNCRCRGKSISQTEIDTLGITPQTAMQAQQILDNEVTEPFNINPADAILPKSGSYFSGIRSANDLNYSKFGMDSASKIASTMPSTEISSMSAKEVSKMLSGVKYGNDFKIDCAVFGCSFILSKQLIQKLEMSGAVGANLLPEAIMRPTEIWVKWNDPAVQKEAAGVMLLYYSNAIYAVKFRNNVIEDAFIVRSAMEADTMREGVLVS